MRSNGIRIAAMCILFLAGAETARAAEPSGLKLAPNPEWCHEGYRCVTTKEYGQMTKIKVNLEESLKLAKAGSRHFGFGCAIGPSLGVTVDSDLNAHLLPSMGVTCGAAVKF